MKLPLKTLLLSLLLLAALSTAVTAQNIISISGTPGIPDSDRILKSRTTIDVTADGYIKTNAKYADGSAVVGVPIIFTVFNGQEKVSGYAMSSDENGAAQFKIPQEGLHNRTVKIMLRYLERPTFSNAEKELGEVVFDEQGQVAEIKYASANDAKHAKKKKRSKK